MAKTQIFSNKKPRIDAAGFKEVLIDSFHFATIKINDDRHRNHNFF